MTFLFHFIFISFCTRGRTDSRARRPSVWVIRTRGCSGRLCNVSDDSRQHTPTTSPNPTDLADAAEQWRAASARAPANGDAAPAATDATSPSPDDCRRPRSGAVRLYHWPGGHDDAHGDDAHDEPRLQCPTDANAPATGPTTGPTTNWKCGFGLSASASQ